jgi:hypothetical protein
MGVGVGRGHIPLFDGDLCRRSVTAGFDSRLFGSKARDMEMVAEQCPEKHEQGGDENRGYGATPGETRQLCSRALLRSDGGEGRPALLDILATAVRADDVFLLMFGNSQTLRECFLAGVTEELVVGH